MSKPMTAARAANLAREVDALSKHAARCVVEAVSAEHRGDKPAALKLFDKQAAAEKRIKELLAIPAVARALDEMAAAKPAEPVAEKSP